MKTSIFLATTLLTAMASSSCSTSLGTLSADNFIVTPSPLEAKAGEVVASINGRFPEKFMKKKAVVTIIPELHFAGTKLRTTGARFQGEKVVGNAQTIDYKLGGNYVMKANFDYLPAMAASELYLSFEAKVGKKVVNIPSVKVAEGVLASSQLVFETARTITTATADDAYQQNIALAQAAQIKYLINQAKIRTSELNATSVKDFVQVLRNIKADQKGFALDNIEVAAYASPEGGMMLNTQLAEEREQSASRYVAKELKENKLNAPVDAKYTAEDWEGFQELVKQSNIQDKDVILRVLALYKDPEEREAQIRQLALAFRELADEVLPELRRARLTINYRIIGRTDSEILEQLHNDPSKLSVEELLYAANHSTQNEERKAIFTTTTKLYPTDLRAYNGLAQVTMAEGDFATATQLLERAGDGTEAQANAAIIALCEGRIAEAEELLGKALTAKNYREILGNIQIARGNYAQAAENLAATKSNSAALAQLLSKNYTAAAATLADIAQPDAYTAYLNAIVAARAGQTAAAIDALRKAVALHPNLAKRAAQDMEFEKLRGEAEFLTLVQSSATQK